MTSYFVSIVVSVLVDGEETHAADLRRKTRASDVRLLRAYAHEAPES